MAGGGAVGEEEEIGGGQLWRYLGDMGPQEWGECSSRTVVDKHGGRRKVEK